MNLIGKYHGNQQSAGRLVFYGEKLMIQLPLLKSNMIQLPLVKNHMIQLPLLKNLMI